MIRPFQARLRNHHVCSYKESPLAEGIDLDWNDSIHVAYGIAHLNQLQQGRITHAGRRNGHLLAQLVGVQQYRQHTYDLLAQIINAVAHEIHQSVAHRNRRKVATGELQRINCGGITEADVLRRLAVEFESGATANEVSDAFHHTADALFDVGVDEDAQNVGRFEEQVGIVGFGIIAHHVVRLIGFLQGLHHCWIAARNLIHSLIYGFRHGYVDFIRQAQQRPCHHAGKPYLQIFHILGVVLHLLRGLQRPQLHHFDAILDGQLRMRHIVERVKRFVVDLKRHSCSFAASTSISSLSPSGDPALQ